MSGLQDAIGSDVRAYAGSQEELSRRVCGSATGLRYKLAHYKQMHFRPEELVMLQLLAGSRHTVGAMAAELGGVFLQLPPVDETLANGDLESELSAVQERLADLLREMREAKRDGEIDSGERRRLDARGHEVIAQLTRYLALSYQVYGSEAVLPFEG